MSRDPNVPDPGTASLRFRWGPPALIAAAVFAAFWPALSGAWLWSWDDNVNFLRNPHFRGLGAGNLAWMFTNTMGHYMPLTWMTLGLDYELWGMDPAGYHFTNVLLHAVNTLLAFRLLRVLFARRRPDLPAGRLAAAALAGALVYALHPMRVESVAWITERRDLVCGLFFFPAVTAYLRAAPDGPGAPVEKKGLRWSLLFFALSLLSKTIGMTLPFVLLLLDAWPLGRFRRDADGRLPWRGLLAEKTPYFLLTAAAVVVTAITTQNAGSFGKEGAYDVAQVVTQPAYKLALYVGKTLVPTGLTPVTRYHPPTGLFEARYLLSWALVLAVSGILFAARRRAPGGLAAWAVFVALLGPFLSPVQAGPHVVADRYTYLAALAVGAAAGGALLGLLAAPRPARLAAGAATAGLILALGAASHAYCRVWRDGEALWSRAVEVDPTDEFAWNNLGSVRLQKGDFAQALKDFQEGLRQVPGDAKLHANVGLAKIRTGDPKGALESADRAAEILPSLAWAHFVRGEALRGLGRLPEAEAAFSKAIEADRVLIEAYTWRGMVRGMLGRPKEAVADCTLALMLEPNYPRAYVNRGVARGELGDLNGALEDYAAALRLQPGLAEAWGGKGMCYALQGRWAEAVDSFEQALSSAPADWPFRRDTERRLAEARRNLPRR